MNGLDVLQLTLYAVAVLLSFACGLYFGLVSIKCGQRPGKGETVKKEDVVELCGLTTIPLVMMICFFGLTIHGIYLAFCTSIVFGFVVVFIEPAPIVISLVYLILGKNLPEIIVSWLKS